MYFENGTKNILAPFWLMECQSTQCTHKSFTIMWGKTVEKLVTLVLPNKTISLTNNFLFKATINNSWVFRSVLKKNITFFYSYSFSSNFLQAITIDKPSTHFHDLITKNHIWIVERGQTYLFSISKKTIHSI